jgi:parallel beta-helix repeat protein
MRKMARSAYALLPLVAIACAPAARQPAASPAPGVVHVAPPTGERETDRASILAAREQVQPGGTVQFAAGTYLVGEIIPIATPRLTLLGDPAGTTLRACEAEDFAGVGDAMIAGWTSDADPLDPSRLAKVHACDLLQLTGGHATVRNLTFEQAWTGLTLGCCEMDERGVQQTEGGYLIEDNTFRDIINGIRGILAALDSSVIRGNRFINTYHAVAANGSHLHVLDNQVSVPDPARVSSIGHAATAIALSGGTMIDMTGQTAVPCDGNVVTGNRIEGHTDGILIVSTPGATCRRNTIRGNTIVVATPSFDPDSPVGRTFEAVDGAPSMITGVPLGLYTLGDPRENANGVEETVIEGNTVTGAIGLGIELVRAAGNRVTNNTVTGIRRREPFPGNIVGFPPAWAEANGSGIWISPGSAENEIIGNTFAYIAAHAVVVEGDSNVVETLSVADGVRDLGTGNRVTSKAVAQDVRSIRVDGERLHYLDFGGDGLPVLFTAGSRAGDTWADFAPRFTDRHRVIAITHRGVPPSEGRETGYVQRARDILALLDSLGLERAVLVGNSNPAPVLIYIAEHHPQRVAGFVFLAPASEAGFETAQDPSGAMQMVERAFLSTQGRDPDEAGGLDDGHLYRPRYFESGSPGISIPALTFMNRDGTRGLERVIYPLQLAELIAAGTYQIPDSVSRSYFERLAADSDMQQEVRAAWNTDMAAPMIANEQAFARAFGENLRIVQLDVPLMDGVPVVTGYEYRDSPDLIEADIRQFLAEMTVRDAADPVDAFIHERMATIGIPGVSLAVLRGTEVLKAAAYGRSSLELDVHTSPATLFPYASMTKAVAATAILRLVEGGRLSLDDRIGELIPGLPEAWSGVPLRRLLDQSSGLPDVLRTDVDVLPYTIRETVLAPTTDSAMAALSTMSLQFGPGERIEYNHTNSMLLAMLLHRLDGRSIEEYVLEEFAIPLGLASFVYGDSRVVVPGRASWYTRFDYSSGRPVPCDVRPVWLEYPVFLHAAAGLNGSAVDLGRFIAAIASGELLGEAARREMWTISSLDDGSPARMGPWGLGLGWLVDDRSAHPSVTMMGAGSSAFKHFVDDDLTVVVLTNLQGADPWGLVDGVANVYLRSQQSAR